jgi:predicted metal-binding membrane protein
MTQADWTGAGKATLPRGALAGAASVAVLTVTAWAALVVQALQRGADAGAFLDTLCTPVGLSGASAAGIESALPGSMALWAAMAVGMMLPTAVPMLLSASDRLDEAPGRSGPAAVLAILAGYLGVWLAAASAMAIVQTFGSALLTSLALPPRLAVPAAGVIVGVAGLWQFSAWKQAGLAFCRHPLRRLEDGRAATPRLALREGVDQGLACLVCCSAMMAAMAAAGLMNVFWMAGMALVMTAEKMIARPWFTRLLGVLLVAGGLVLSLSAVGFGTVLRYLAS